MAAKKESSHIDKSKEKEFFDKLSALFSPSSIAESKPVSKPLPLGLISKYSDLNEKSNNILIPYIKVSRHKVKSAVELNVNDTYIIILSGVPGNNIDRVYICQCSKINETGATFIELSFKILLKGISLDIMTDWTPVEKLTLLNIDIVDGDISNIIKELPTFIVTIYGGKKDFKKSNIRKVPYEKSDSNLKADSGGKKKTIKKKNIKKKTTKRKKNIKRKKNTTKKA